MPSIETVDFHKFKDVQTNISDVVGECQRNERNDVLLIQTLFKLIGFNDIASKRRLGLSAKDLPELTGDYDEKMTRAIWAFQRKWAHSLRNIDGKIHPASYQNRVLKKGAAGQQMTITLLNMLAAEEALMMNSVDLISAIKKISPSIIFAPASQPISKKKPT
jgi:hypothetical protein